jgi:hypothetical protein
MTKNLPVYPLWDTIRTQWNDYFQRDHSFTGQSKSIALICFLSLNLISGIVRYCYRQDITFTLLLNYAYISFNIILFFLYAKQKLNLNTTIFSVITITQTAMTLQMVYGAYFLFGQEDQKILFLNSMFYYPINVLFALIAFQKKLIYVLTVIAFPGFCLAIAVTHDCVLAYNGLIILYIAVIEWFVGYWLSKNKVTEGQLSEFLQEVKKPIDAIGDKVVSETQNDIIQNETDRKQAEKSLQGQRIPVRVFNELALHKQPTYKTEHLLELLGKEARHNIIDNVRELLMKKDTEQEYIAQNFPELTPSETKICQLILQDKKLTEICRLLNKSESNINTQRAHIRKKLDLKPTDNLQQALEERMREKSKN